MLKRSIVRIALVAIAAIGLAPQSAQAGPLIDWLFGRSRPQAAYPVGQPVPLGNGYAAGYGVYPNQYSAGYAPNYGSSNAGYAANLGTYYSTQLPVIGTGGYGYPAPMQSGITAASVPPTLSYVPNFRSDAYRAPVTYYRPLMTTDPNTGAQVVAMAPCTSYEYQTQRVPTFGRSALFGSNAPQLAPPAPVAPPTYTLPSGGIPLAFSTPSVTLPTVRAYGSYSALQPSYGQPTFPTAPLGSTYYGSNSGGSCGNVYNPNSYQAVPGLVAPQAPQSSVPFQPAPTSNPTAPFNSAPVMPGTDPANVQPYLPPNFPTSSNTERDLRPQLRSVTQQPRESSSDAQGETGLRKSPVMTPIPVPSDFDHEPRWNPGLLSEDDLTAGLRPVNQEAAQLAGQAKRIHWASFEQSDNEVAGTSGPTLQLTAPKAQQPRVSLRPVINSPSSIPGAYRTPDLNSADSTSSKPSTPNRSRHVDSTGWRASR